MRDDWLCFCWVKYLVNNLGLRNAVDLSTEPVSRVWKLWSNICSCRNGRWGRVETSQDLSNSQWSNSGYLELSTVHRLLHTRSPQIHLLKLQKAWTSDYWPLLKMSKSYISSTQHYIWRVATISSHMASFTHPSVQRCTANLTVSTPNITFNPLSTLSK